MGTMVQFIEGLLYTTPEPPRVRPPATQRLADQVEREREQPILFAEIVAASAFLDFGGVPDERWFHALYAWRVSESAGSAVEFPRRNERSASRSRAAPRAPENNNVDESLKRRKNNLLSMQIEA
jgi:hypothetical protein